jgi:hypothetical protein
MMQRWYFAWLALLFEGFMQMAGKGMLHPYFLGLGGGAITLLLVLEGKRLLTPPVSSPAQEYLGWVLMIGGSLVMTRSISAFSDLLYY